MINDIRSMASQLGIHLSIPVFSQSLNLDKLSVSPFCSYQSIMLA